MNHLESAHFHLFPLECLCCFLELSGKLGLLGLLGVSLLCCFSKRVGYYGVMLFLGHCVDVLSTGTSITNMPRNSSRATSKQQQQPSKQQPSKKTADSQLLRNAYGSSSSCCWILLTARNCNLFCIAFSFDAGSALIFRPV